MAAACKRDGLAHPSPVLRQQRFLAPPTKMSPSIQSNHPHQDLIGCLYINALKATFDRMLHLLNEHIGDQSSYRFLSSTVLCLFRLEKSVSILVY